MDTVINITDWNQFWIQQLIILAGVLVAAYFAKKTWKTSQFNNQIYCDELLFNSRTEVRNLMIKLEESKSKLIGKYYMQSVEDMLNAYELACGLYLSGGLDYKRFKKLRKKEIISLFESETEGGKKTYPVLHKKDNPYFSIEEVYYKFKDKED
jgi:hypothetical protein